MKLPGRLVSLSAESGPMVSRCATVHALAAIAAKGAENESATARPRYSRWAACLRVVKLGGSLLDDAAWVDPFLLAGRAARAALRIDCGRRGAAPKSCGNGTAFMHWDRAMPIGWPSIRCA